MSAVSRFTVAVTGVVTAILLAPVRLYQRFISPALPARCKYHPSCSAYASQALRELGPVRGTVVGAWRVARCNPWSNGGYDPLSARTLFRDADGAPTAGPSGSGGTPA